MDDFLRNQCKYLKCYQGISYKEIAEYYSFSIDRKEKLKGIIDTLRED